MKIKRLHIITFLLLVGWLILKSYIRPIKSDFIFIQIIADTFPNFAAICAFVLGAVFERSLKLPHNRQRINYYGLTLALMVFIIFEEYKPMFSANKTYDPNDIIATIVGALIMLVLFELQKANKIDLVKPVFILGKIK